MTSAESLAEPRSADADDGLAVQTFGLTRRFGRFIAVDDVSLSVPRGAVFGFLGPNGSGKTTTIRMLLALMAPTAGEISVLGGRMPQASGDVLPRVGTLVEGPGFHPYLSGLDNLRRLDAFDASTDPATSRSRIAAALDRVGLSAAASKRYRRYSLGMKQRLGLAATLLRPRDLLILDEPTNGLDPQGTREVRGLIRDLAADGTTVLLSSHLLGEIEQVATHVAIMSGGKLLTQGELREVLASTSSVIRVVTRDGGLAASILDRLGMQVSEQTPQGVAAFLNGVEPERVAAELVGAGVGLRGFNVERPALEDLFVQLTGEGFDVLG